MKTQAISSYTPTLQKNNILDQQQIIATLEKKRLEKGESKAEKVEKALLPAAIGSFLALDVIAAKRPSSKVLAALGGLLSFALIDKSFDASTAIINKLDGNNGQRPSASNAIAQIAGGFGIFTLAKNGIKKGIGYFAQKNPAKIEQFVKQSASFDNAVSNSNIGKSFAKHVSEPISKFVSKHPNIFNGIKKHAGLGILAGYFVASSMLSNKVQQEKVDFYKENIDKI